MEVEDDMYLLIVGDELGEDANQMPAPEVLKEETLNDREGIFEYDSDNPDLGSEVKKEESEDSISMEPILVEEEQDEEIDTDIKVELLDVPVCYDYEYLYDWTAENTETIKEEDNQESDEDYVPEKESGSENDENDDYENENSHYSNNKICVEMGDITRHRYKMLSPQQRRSFVKDLKIKYPELRNDEGMLVRTLAEIMRAVRPPPVPDGCIIGKDKKHECVFCGHKSQVKAQAKRHFQEKHGPRYLVCFACGVDFRSITNIYKHEKICKAPDAHIVLKARATCLGRKARVRPYLKQYANDVQQPVLKKSSVVVKFPCSMCSAVFTTKASMLSHENLHRGERPYHCDKCPRAYASPSALNRHSQVHMGYKYVCDHCHRRFKIKAILAAHMNTHAPEGRYPCEECGRRFATNYARRLHVHRDHRRLPAPFACHICDKRYLRMSVLKKHMQHIHGLAIVSRSMFTKSLGTLPAHLKQAKIVLKSDLEAENEIAKINGITSIPITKKRNEQQSEKPKKAKKVISAQNDDSLHQNGVVMPSLPQL